MSRKQIICLTFGILLCIPAGALIGWYILDFIIGFASYVYSWYSPEAWLLVGMFVIGLALIIFALDIKIVENND